MTTKIKDTIKRVFRGYFLRRRIRRQLSMVGPGGELRLILGGHWAEQAGWLVLTEAELDITKKLDIPDNSVDVIFMEHVIEHVSFMDGVNFVREARRVLKPGGVLRLVFPALERVLGSRFDSGFGAEYFAALRPSMAAEEESFRSLGFDGLAQFPREFFLNAIFTGYGHKFIWSAAMMAKVMSAAGFGSASVRAIGQGTREGYCIERRRRGIYRGNDQAEDRRPGCIYDAESLAVEGVK